MPAFVQTANSGTPSGTATSKTVTFSTTAQTAGNLNVIAITFGSGTASSFTVPSISVTDSSANAYVAVGTMVQHGGYSGATNSCGSILYYAPNIAAAAAGANTVTVTLGTAMSFFIVSVFELSGLPPNHVIDNYIRTFSNGGTSAVNTGTVNCTNTGHDILFGYAECFDSPSSIGSGYTQVENIYVALAGYDVVLGPGAFGFTATSAGLSGWTAWMVAFSDTALIPPAPSNIATEVLLNNTMTSSQDVPANLQDANSWTFWNTTATGVRVIIDAGAALSLTRIRISPQGGAEDLCIGGQFQASNAPDFSSGVTTIYTISQRPVSGTLLNEYAVSISGYRYFCYLTASATNSGLADLDFIGIYQTGVVGIPCTPTLSPTQAQYDVPTNFRLSCITTDAAIYYTLDGSNPTPSSSHYTKPITISSSCTLKAVAISPAGATSRQITYPIHIVNTEVSNDYLYDNRGYRLWATNGSILFDPVSGYWYRYGVNFDTPAIYANGWLGNNIYRSPDLRNWEFRGVAMAPAANTATGPSNNEADICMRVLYNAANNNYVAWTDSYTVVSISNFVWIGKKVWVASSPDGPFVYQSTVTSLTGSDNPEGDFSLFLASDGVTGYIASTNSGNTSLSIAKLNAAYTAVAGGGTANNYTYTSLYGSGIYEAPYMFYNGTKYILAQSPSEAFGTYYATYCCTASLPLGPLTYVSGNPFQPVGGGTPDYTQSYSSQIWQILNIPGRNAWIYHGDNYGLVGNAFTNTVRIRLPVTFPGSGVPISISWLAAWSFDGQFPTVSGAPLAATGLVAAFSHGAINLLWVNHEPKACAIYVDRANDAGFTTSVSSEVQPSGATTFSDSLVTPGSTYYYRIRSVNANGSTMSSTLSFTATAGSGIVPSLIGAYNFWGAGDT